MAELLPPAGLNTGDKDRFYPAKQTKHLPTAEQIPMYRYGIK